MYYFDFIIYVKIQVNWTIFFYHPETQDRGSDAVGHPNQRQPANWTIKKLME